MWGRIARLQGCVFRGIAPLFERLVITVVCTPGAVRWLLPLLVLFSCATGTARAADDDNAPTNVYMTGAEVRMDRPTDGDLVAAAGRIHIDQPIAGDAVVGAGSIDVQAAVGEDLRGAGGIVTLGGRVGHEVLLAAARIILTPAAEVLGETWLAAWSVTLDGRLASAVRVYARDITIRGELYGPLELSADRIEIAAGARIHGDVLYSSDQDIKVDPLAVVEGKLVRKAKRLEPDTPQVSVPWLKPLRPVLVAALLAFAMLLVALFPAASGGSMHILAAAPGRSLGLGTALFFSVPPVAVLLIITIIGIPVALALLVVQAIALVCGYVVTAMLIGHGIARACGIRRLSGWRQYAFLTAAVIMLSLAASIPYLGVVLLALACSAGLGAIVLQRFGRRRDRDMHEWPAA